MANISKIESLEIKDENGNVICSNSTGCIGIYKGINITSEELEKLIPKQMVRNEKHQQSCPSCGNYIGGHYCHYCGQKIKYN